MQTAVRQHMRQMQSSLGQLLRPSIVSDYQKDQQNAFQPNGQNLALRLADVISRTWHLGITAFGGPPVHFSIFHQMFTENSGVYAPWIDEQTYQEIFALCQSLPGPASTKMLFTIVLMHAGLFCAAVAFLLWSLPGAIAMFGLSFGIANASERLPEPVYALLSGLNAASVGIITLAAVGLSSKAAKDNLTRILVIGGGCAGLCYTALWFFPVLIVIGGLTALLWDLVVSRWIGKLRTRAQRRRQRSNARATEEAASDVIPLSSSAVADKSQVQRRTGAQSSSLPTARSDTVEDVEVSTNPAQTAPVPAPKRPGSDMYSITPRVGFAIVALFLAAFIGIMVGRSLVAARSLAFSLFANMFLAGTIIFGGGPVVIPLLREYVVEPGWVSARDFLIGLAVIQALPGPNFNFAVYLGALALKQDPAAGLFGGLVAFIGIFAPGLALTVGFQGFWEKLRTKAWFVSVLRGINSVAVGFVYTAVYRLWEIGYVTSDSTTGKSLAQEPWWVVVAVLAYSASSWFKVPAAGSIIGGGILGLCWYGVTRR